MKEKYPFLIKYFKNGICDETKNIAHCILFYGSDLQAQYDLALEISRLLNCKNTKNDTCQCLNCNWIRENKHPAVLTISRFDNKASGDENKANINITINQAREIRNNLMITSEYHRCLIFCDKDKDGNIQGLNHLNFQTETANALLKTFEEPPSNTTFFFLTKDKSDIINTVVSRAQCFYVPSILKEDNDFTLVKDIMAGYLELERNEVLDFNNKLSDLIKEHDAELIFIQMQNFIKNLLNANLENKPLKIKLINDIKSIEKAKKEFNLNINIQTIIETLSFDLIL